MDGKKPHETVPLKVPKCEIFDGLDFHDFYAIQYLWVGECKFTKEISKATFDNYLADYNITGQF
jgi:hypothetical protein